MAEQGEKRDWTKEERYQKALLLVGGKKMIWCVEKETTDVRRQVKVFKRGKEVPPEKTIKIWSYESPIGHEAVYLKIYSVKPPATVKVIENGKGKIYRVPKLPEELTEIDIKWLDFSEVIQRADRIVNYSGIEVEQLQKMVCWRSGISLDTCEDDLETYQLLNGCEAVLWSRKYRALVIYSPQTFGGEYEKSKHHQHQLRSGEHTGRDVSLPQGGKGRIQLVFGVS